MENQSMAHLSPNKIDESRDQLNKMLEVQKEFNKKFYDKTTMTLEDKQEWTQKLVLAIHGELSEIQEHINWKWWKKPTLINEHEIRYELADIQAFLNSLYDVWGMDYKMVAGYYESKMEENHNRQKRGY